jgi:NAD(P)H-dependent FMN reductase
MTKITVVTGNPEPASRTRAIALAAADASAKEPPAAETHRYGNNGLAGVTAVPVMTGGWPGHLLAVEVHLRPVLVELGATVPSRGPYVTEPEFADLTSALAKWSASAIPLIRGTLDS